MISARNLSARLSVLGLLTAALALGCTDGAGTTSTSSTTGAGTSTGGGGSGGAGGSAPATCPAGTPYTELSGKILADTEVNGLAFHFIIDTGAPISGLDVKAAQKLGKGPYEVTVGGKKKTFANLVQDDFLAHGVKADGIIGTDFLGQLALTVDYQRSVFMLDDAIDEASLLACTHVLGMPATHDVVHDDYFYVEGRVEGTPGIFLIDTGASLGGMPNTTFATLNAAHPRAAIEGFYTPAAVGTFWAKLTTMGELSVGTQAVRGIATRTVTDGALPAPTAGGNFLGLLPSGFFRHFMTTLDYKNAKLRLDGYAGDDFQEPSRFFSTGIGLEENVTPPIHVSQVLSGSSASDQGVLVGDELVAIDGMSVGSIEPYSRPWMLLSFAPHASVGVTLKRGGQTIDLMLETRELLKAP